MEDLKESRMYRLLSIAVLAFAALPSCASSKGEETNGPDTPGYVVPGVGGTGNLTGSEALAKCSPAVCAGVTSPGPTCSAEVCDGFDNDCNGVVDDVDSGSDGVCDCIRIATLGTPGTWGKGDVFGAWLSARSTNGATSLGDQELTESLLNQFDIVIAQNVNSKLPSDGSGGIGRTYSQAEVDALASFVSQRGGFMTMIGFSDSSERSNVNALLATFGLAYGSEQILQKTNGVTVAVKTWYQHPTSANISAVGVDNGYEAQSAQNVGTVIAEQGGYDIGRAVDVGAGRVLQWGDEWITYNSEWTEHTDYQVQLFWLNIIKWLTPANYCQVAIPPVLIN
jgi:hypothetical protein